MSYTLHIKPCAADVNACSRVRHVTLRTRKMTINETTMITERLRSTFPNFCTLRLFDTLWADNVDTDELRLDLSAYAKPNL